MPSYNDYQSMDSWGGSYKQPQQVPMFNAGQSFAPSSMFGNTDWTPASDFSFSKRPDALSAGVATGSDYFTGAGQAFRNGDYMGGLKDFGNGLGDSLGGKDFWMGGKDASGMQTLGAAGVGLDLFKALSGYLGARSTEKLGRAQLAQSKEISDRNFAIQSKLVDSQLADRQDRRSADARSQGLTAESTQDYMRKYGTKAA